jgi:uncharacterized membrane protein
MEWKTLLFLYNRYNPPQSYLFVLINLIQKMVYHRPQRVIPTVNTSQEKVKQQLQLLRDASGVYDGTVTATEVCIPTTSTSTGAPTSHSTLAYASAAAVYGGGRERSQPSEFS